MYSEPVRAYLLGILDESKSAAVEQKYFTDRAFFLFTRAEETRLIEDYLAARLSPPETRQFEERYLSVPELRAMVEEIRQQREVLRAPSRPVLRRWLAAAAMVLICAGGVIFLQRRGPAPVSRGPILISGPPLLSTLFLCSRLFDRQNVRDGKR